MGWERDGSQEVILEGTEEMAAEEPGEAEGSIHRGRSSEYNAGLLCKVGYGRRGNDGGLLTAIAECIGQRNVRLRRTRPNNKATTDLDAGHGNGHRWGRGEDYF